VLLLFIILWQQFAPFYINRITYKTWPIIFLPRMLNSYRLVFVDCEKNPEVDLVQTMFIQVIKIMKLI